MRSPQPRTVKEALEHPTLPLTIFGKIFLDLSRNGSYSAAARGDIQVLTMGRLKLVAVTKEAKRLGLLEGEGA